MCTYAHTYMWMHNFGEIFERGGGTVWGALLNLVRILLFAKELIFT